MTENIWCGNRAICSDHPGKCGSCLNNLFVKRSMYRPADPVEKLPPPPGPEKELTYEKELPFHLEDLKKLEFKNPGELYAACQKYFKLLPSQVNPWIKNFDISIKPQRHLAWITIIEKASAPVKGG